ncbi:type III-A CRISPR-associated RAMP protein Csm3 [Dissulfurispira thermophila]|uniref:CRISPR system Cms endoribonuclease Csm3 n=1 Tax=Dissulfurispira thermophila TaxID=2715679 RepID=A0A7G1H381_9BACT|nr:type III-A CRISPR-associated RAMP protein Csm3 [Dissulfurispira thermophila]BCB96602.1 type III-A CRISPR-associated RAMP protein Csm3 [Dissulfurispira thermophila]
MDKNILGKVQINGKIKCLTGLHIGASKENMEIGAIDSPVVRDPVTRQPYIPGSSLKGKMRSLLERALSVELGIAGTTKRRNIGTRNNEIWIHVCDSAEDALQCPICRIFGSTGHNGGKNFPARLAVRDAYLTGDSVEKLSDIDTGLQYTEWKFENAIDRVTSAANPRQLERVPRGAEFDFELIYNVEDLHTVEEDLKNLALAIDLITLDSLGGHGSRGYGKVDIVIECIKGIPVESLKSDTIIAVEIKSLKELSSLITTFRGKSSGA